MIRIDLIRMARTCLLTALILAAGFGSRLARAQAQAPAADPADEASADSLSYERGGLLGLGAVAGLKLGGGFGAPFNEMAASFVGELELGYNLPVLQRALGIFLSGQYAAPSMEQKDIVDGYASGGGTRLPGPASYTLTTSEAMITLGAVYRIAVPVPLLRPYVGLGGRYVMMSTEVSGEAGGQAFGTNTETADDFGLYAALGGELHIGPGAALLELQWSRVQVDQYILRNTNVSALNVALGYRLFL